METISRGNGAEAIVLAAFVGRGLPVLTPFGEGHAYDLALDLGGSTLLRVQVKSAWIEGGCLAFNSRSTDHGNGSGHYVGRADVFGVCSKADGSVYVVPVAGMPTSRIYLRRRPAKNNQLRRVRLAEDYKLDRWSASDLIALVETGQAASLDRAA